MAWYIMPFHGLAHIQPTLVEGTEVTGFAIGNIRTLNPFNEARVAPASGDIEIQWDRGTGTKIPLDSLLWINNTYGSGNNAAVEMDTASSFASPTDLFDTGGTAEVTVRGGDSWRLLDTDCDEQYVRWEVPSTSVNPQIWGLFSLGVSIEVASSGPSITTEQHAAVPVGSGPGGRPLDGGVERVTFSFRKVTRATADQIMRYAALDEIWFRQSATTTLAGIGGGGGTNLIAVINDAGGTGFTGNTGGSGGGNQIYYGLASVTVKPWAANYSEVFVTMDRIPPGSFAY